MTFDLLRFVRIYDSHPRLRSTVGGLFWVRWTPTLPVTLHTPFGVSRSTFCLRHLPAPHLPLRIPAVAYTHHTAATFTLHTIYTLRSPHPRYWVLRFIGGVVWACPLFRFRFTFTLRLIYPNLRLLDPR